MHLTITDVLYVCTNICIQYHIFIYINAIAKRVWEISFTIGIMQFCNFENSLFNAMIFL